MGLFMSLGKKDQITEKIIDAAGATDFMFCYHFLTPWFFWIMLNFWLP